MANKASRPERAQSRSRESGTRRSDGPRQRQGIGSQLSLLSTWQKDRFAFGGSMLVNSHAKTKRPFHKRLAIHVVMRSTLATGSWSLLKKGQGVEKVLLGEAKRQNVKLHSAANAGNHIHLLLQAPSREHLSAYLKAVSGRIARFITGSGRDRPLPRRFWDQRPFSRLVSLGRDFLQVSRYLALNSTESAGFSRSSARAMFREIREALLRGQIPRLPSLIAAGFF